jgi:transposase
MNAPSLVPDDLWEAIEPLLPKEPPKPRGGRPRVPNRAALAGIVFVLRTGCPWRLLPKALGCGSGVTCWRRLRDWQEAGVWQRLHETLLNWLGDEAAVDWSRASLDSISVRAKRGASRPDRTQQTGASSAPSITSWWTGPASRWRFACQPPTPTTPLNCCRSSMPSHPSSAQEGSRGDRASGRPSCTRTRPTTRRISAALCALAALHHESLAVASTPVRASGGTAGWSSARSPGCWGAVASASAMSDRLICSKGSSTWPVP